MAASGSYLWGLVGFILYHCDIQILNIQGARRLSLNSFHHVNAHVYIVPQKILITSIPVLSVK